MADTTAEKGDQVSWQWGSSKPSGEISGVVKEGEASVESNKGNTITKEAKPDDPAVSITRPGNDVVKNASELEVESKADEGGKTENNGTAEPKESEKKSEENGDTKVGEKREHTVTEANGNGTKTAEADEDQSKPTEAAAEADKEEDEPPTKKQKTAEATGEDDKGGEPVKKGRGRPKKTDSNGVQKGPAKKKEPKKAATESGEPRRSGRNRE